MCIRDSATGGGIRWGTERGSRADRTGPAPPPARLNCANGRGISMLMGMDTRAETRVHHTQQYRVPTVVASRDCEDQPTLVKVGILRTHGHSVLANRCSEVTY
eukprot:2940929-Prymnesium_polylepis.1